MGMMDRDWYKDRYQQKHNKKNRTLDNDPRETDEPPFKFSLFYLIAFFGALILLVYLSFQP